MNTPINLSKVKQCDQHWDDMSICDKGRVCGKCQETIVDFRGLTDLEIGLIHGSSRKKICGIYDQHRLQPYDVVDASLSSKKKMLWAGALSMLFSGSIQAKDVPMNSFPELMEVLQGSEDLKTSYLRRSTSEFKDSLHIVRGTLRDDTGQVIIGCTVLLQKTKNGAITDIDGSFSLDVSKRLKKKKTVTLVFSYIGYGNKEITISKSDFDQRKELYIDITLRPIEMLTTFSVYTRPPFFKRVWLGITNVFRKKENKR